MSEPAGTVDLTVEDAVAVVTLSRPQVLNALSWTMYDQLNRHLDALAGDDGVRVVVLRGAGGQAFAVGADTRQFADFTGEDGIAYSNRVDETISRLWHLPKPTLVAIEGYAVGGGFNLAAACDLRYANASARLGVPVARTLGNCLAFGNYRRLVTIVGEMKLKELMFTGRLMDAAEALRIDFLTDVFPDEEFWPAVQEVARRIASNAPLTIWATKMALVRLEEHKAATTQVPFDDVIRRVYGSSDFHQAVLARQAKRRPEWRGC